MDTKCISTCIYQNPSYNKEDTKWISTCVEQTPHMPMITQNYHNMCWPNPRILARTEIPLQHVWPNPSHTSEDTTCISTRGDLAPPMAARTQCVSQLVLTKHITCQREHKILLNMCWPSYSHASKHTKCISTCVEQTHHIPARTQNVSTRVGTITFHVSEDISEIVLTKLLTCQRRHKMHLNICWPNALNAILDTNSI